MFAWFDDGEGLRELLATAGYCREGETPLLVARARATTDGRAWLPLNRGRLLVITPRQVLLLRRQGVKGVLRGRYPLICELRLQLGGIKRVVLEGDQGPRFTLSTESVGNIDLESAEAKSIVDVLQTARRRAYLQSPGSFRIDITDLTPEGASDCGYMVRPDVGLRAETGSSLQGGPPQRRRSVVSTGHNFDRLRRSSAIRKMFESASEEVAAGGDPRKVDEIPVHKPLEEGALHRMISLAAAGHQGRPRGTEQHAEDKQDAGEMVADVLEIRSPLRPPSPGVVAPPPGYTKGFEGKRGRGSFLSRRKSVISTADNFETSRRSSLLRGERSLRTQKADAEHQGHGRGSAASLYMASAAGEALVPATCRGETREPATQGSEGSRRRETALCAARPGGRGSTAVEALSAANLHAASEEARAGGASGGRRARTGLPSSRHVLCEGYLSKQRHAGIVGLRAWHRRFFRLSPEALSYCADRLGGGMCSRLVRGESAESAERVILLADIMRVELVGCTAGAGGEPAAAIVLYLSGGGGGRRLKLRGASGLAGAAAAAATAGEARGATATDLTVAQWFQVCACLHRLRRAHAGNRTHACPRPTGTPTLTPVHPLPCAGVEQRAQMRGALEARAGRDRGARSGNARHRRRRASGQDGRTPRA